MNMLKVKKSITLLVGMMTITALGGIAQAVETRFAVQDSTGTVDQMVVTDTGNIGIGTSTPGYPLQIIRAGASAATTLEFNNPGNPTNGQPYDAPTIQLMRNNIITVNNGVPRSDDRLGYFNFGTYFGTTPKFAAGISANAEGSSWSSTSYPGYLSLMTTSSTGTYPSERVRISSWGGVGIGTSNPTQRLEVNGGVRLNTGSTKPSCSVSTRGTVWFTNGAAGVADKLEVCAKDASDIYSWKALF